MMHLANNPAVKVRPGTRIIGKWHKRRYDVVRRLGYGSIGAVYLVQSRAKYYALKIGYDKMGIISEVNALKRLTRIEGQSQGPFFVEMDDWGQWTFYVMEYIAGRTLHSFVKEKGEEWIAVLMLQLLKELDNLHRQGFVFGDLKPENLIVATHPPRMRWLDVGGVTKIGHAVKEFSTFYDRAYWEAGSRKAEPSYDLFSVAMIFLHFAYPKLFAKNVEGVRRIEKKVLLHPLLQPYKTILLGAIRGSYDTAAEMHAELLMQLNGVAKGTRLDVQRKKRRRRKRYRAMFVITLFLVLFLLYLKGKGVV